MPSRVGLRVRQRLHRSTAPRLLLRGRSKGQDGVTQGRAHRHDGHADRLPCRCRHRAHEAPHWPFLRMVSLWLPAWRSLNGSAVAVSVRACEHADDLDPVVILVDAV